MHKHLEVASTTAFTEIHIFLTLRNDFPTVISLFLLTGDTESINTHVRHATSPRLKVDRQSVQFHATLTRAGPSQHLPPRNTT